MIAIMLSLKIESFELVLKKCKNANLVASISNI
jgi:hypothetical protein